MSKISLDVGAIMSILSENRYSIMETPQDSLMNQLQNEFREGHPQSKDGAILLHKILILVKFMLFAMVIQ